MRGLLVALLALLVGCGGGSAPEAGGSDATATPAPSAQAAKDAPPQDPCTTYPPPFEASYLPEGFKYRLRKGAGLFKGADYPAEGLLGHYRGKAETVHVNFEVQGGPLPYEPGNPHPLKVLGRRGQIRKIEGGWAVEFSLGDCDFRMDTYGLDRAETVKVAKGLRQGD
ncbi:MAG: hypothetical protein M3323_10285 [Actinomycetota bacterium]|nr:hypothetical protein [Actinomycetota bacterium]